MTAVGGEVFVYRVTPRTEWLFILERSFERSFKPRPAVSPEAQLKAAVGMTLDALAVVERAAQPKPETSPNIAAE